jgi:hypothetical protein
LRIERGQSDDFHIMEIGASINVHEEAIVAHATVAGRTIAAEIQSFEKTEIKSPFNCVSVDFQRLMPTEFYSWVGTRRITAERWISVAM